MADKKVVEKKSARGETVPHKRDSNGHRVGLVKSVYKKAKKANKQLGSLKAFARSLGDEAKNWFHNKRVNTSKPPLGLGRTRKKK